MTIRSKLTLMTAGLIGAVVLAFAASVTAAQRSAIEDQSRRRVQGLSDGVARMAQESIISRDRFMLMSYLMHLQKEHAQFAFASVSDAGHTATVGADRPGLRYWTLEASEKRPVKYTITAVSRPSGAENSLSVSTAGVRLEVAGNALVTVEEGRRPDVLVLKLGFDAASLDAEIASALKPLRRRVGLIAGGFILLGWLGALSVSKLLTAPLISLTSAVSAVKAGNLDVVVAAGGDELGLLAKHFNEMTNSLKEHTQFREDLLHTLTHELNTPLGGLKGYLELWQDRKIAEGPERAAVLQTMTAAVLRMENSLGNALGLFRGGAKAGAASKRTIWVNELLREACALFTPEAAAKKITIVAPLRNVRAYVHADPELLRQIVANLVSNAVKYTPAKGHIRLAVHDGADDVRLTVEDDGRGIAAEDLPHLFTKFYRAGPDADRQRVKGTGLGLNIAAKAARALGGSISVESALGRGTTFTVTLPKFAPIEEAA